MARSTKPRKIYKRNAEADKNLKAVRNMQSFANRVVITASQSKPDHVLLFKDNKPTKVSNAIAKMFGNIKFEWVMLFGVLCRDQQENLYVRYIVLDTPQHIEMLANDLDKYFTETLKEIFNGANSLHRLTTFYAATPSNQDIDISVIAQMLHHFKVPDLMTSQYELDYKNGKPSKLYCEGTWEQLLLDIQWIEIQNFKPKNIILED